MAEAQPSQITHWVSSGRAGPGVAAQRVETCFEASPDASVAVLRVESPELEKCRRGSAASFFALPGGPSAQGYELLGVRKRFIELIGLLGNVWGRRFEIGGSDFWADPVESNHMTEDRSCYGPCIVNPLERYGDIVLLVQQGKGRFPNTNHSEPCIPKLFRF